MRIKHNRANLKKLEIALLKGLGEDETKVIKLATTVYPEYRNLLHTLNRGERGDIYERYHGYCEQSPNAIASLYPRINTTSPVRLLPVIPNAIKGMPFNPRPVMGRYQN